MGHAGVSSVWEFEITESGKTSAVMVAGFDVASYQIHGTFTADVEVEISNEDAAPSADSEWFSTATESAPTLKNLSENCRWVRFNCSAYTSGTANVRLNVVQ